MLASKYVDSGYGDNDKTLGVNLWETRYNKNSSTIKDAIKAQ